MKTYTVTEEQLRKCLSLNLINCNKMDGTLFKYMPASRVIDFLSNKKHELAFVSPELWYDPYETKYLKTDYSALNGYKQPKIYCFCTRMDNENEEASWKIYKKEGEPLIRLHIATFPFLIKLKEFAQNNNCEIFLSKIDYSLKKVEIDNLYNTDSNFYHTYFDDFNDEKYIKLMSLKRKAFGYENEYRFFIVPRDEKIIPHCIRDNILFVPMELSTIICYTINPMEKMGNNFVSEINYEKYNAECHFLKKTIKNMDPKAKISISTLYSETQTVDKVCKKS